MTRPSAPRPPRYEGRVLPRPDDELQDQGLGFDLTTLVGRRRVLRALGLGAVALGAAACGAGDTTTGDTTRGGTTAAGTTGAAPTGSSEIPDETAGPFPGDGSNGPDVLAESGIVRSDIRSSIGTGTGVAEGVPMILELAVVDIARGTVPFTGAAVYVWHCDRSGGYSLYSEGLEDENYLRGVQIADATGTVRFTSVFPACYPGRWPHVHFEVFPDGASITDAGNAVATSQVALPREVCEQVYARPGYERSAATLSRVGLESDSVFRDDGGASQLASVTGDVTGGYTVSLAVGVDPTTTPRAGGPGGGDGAPRGVPPSGGGPGG
ncbi:intradiol ring-cleavage dioxygenase [Pseudonocardia yuanmonensis]|uniref:intradiol ring-cleavage dioxygenase n=1 Tax=Pseudonocardia yuanmonensis TaxID=1095914 RepID=UPI0031E75FA0